MRIAPSKVLTPREMAEVDRATIEAGIPGIILMENAAQRVVEYIARHFSPVSEQRIVVICGKGNNGGDGLAIARQLHVGFNPRHLWVVLIAEPEEMSGDAALNLKMLRACGVQEYRDFGPEMRPATLVIDAILGTGLIGPAKGPALDAIVEINSTFPFAKVIAVDIPSGLSGDSGTPPGEYARADATVTFTASKVCHVMPPACNLMGELLIAPIGSPASMYENDERIRLALVTPESIAPCFAARPRGSNKGKFGHVLVVAGSRAKPGAASMAGLAALRAGAGLVTVACPESALASVASHTAELMTEPLAATASGEIARSAFDRVVELAAKRTLIAIGPGIGTDDQTREVVLRLFAEAVQPMVVDADALNCLVGSEWNGSRALRVLTPHPGEMSRLTGRTIAEVQADRIAAARSFAESRRVVVVLKGERTLIAFPDGRVWVNPTGSPAMAKGGTGDILTGMVSGLLGQFPDDPDRAIAAAVYLHSLAGEIAARHLTEQPVIATDLLQYLPEAIRGITNIPHPI
jgi:ADP-dependent NAD(P)H-hydrate dehydratase / NAD(P)H-hydrate epimerase